ncbi:hypothetical protein [Thermomonospora amylolytica]|uniref:hypothetical protein n=1 Tax=Thermomonospora amylolytica TaxID=1411117 RepID=UPI0013009BD4|nr:hypothetical protein [Thermomonospora amylolytica]
MSEAVDAEEVRDEEVFMRVFHRLAARDVGLRERAAWVHGRLGVPVSAGCLLRCLGLDARAEHLAWQRWGCRTAGELAARLREESALPRGVGVRMQWEIWSALASAGLLVVGEEEGTADA